MDMKRRSLPLSDSSHVERKRIRTTFNAENNRITCFEDLSNELLYEIIEYLHGCDLYDAFSNLNSRFQRLLSHSTLPLKIRLDSSLKSRMQYYCKNFFIPNKHKILSLYFDDYLIIDTFLAHCIIDSSFQRLESVSFNCLRVDQLMMILFYLKSLPRLYSLNIRQLNEHGDNLGNIYRMIFSLPALKYNRLIVDSFDIDDTLDISLPFAANEWSSAIESLDISHNCNTRQLLSIVRHTPQLRHLTCKYLIGSFFDDEAVVALFHLKYLSIKFHGIALIELDIIIKNIGSQLEVCKIHHHTDDDHFDADRWERMIQNDMPHLQKFEYKYHKYDSSTHMKNAVYMKINQFTSPFWTEQAWFFKAEISNDAIAYSICSHKKRWFDADNEQVNTDRRLSQLIELNRNIQLSIDQTLDAVDQSFIDKYKIVFDCVKFTHLIIDYPTISKELLVKMLQLLPNLDSLKVSSLQLTESDSFVPFDTSINNKITKVCLERITHLNEVNFLLHLCSLMEYFRIHVVEKMDLKSLLCLVLDKTGTFVPRLRSLCLYIPNADEVITHRLKNLIESERPLCKCKVQRRGNKIFLQWD